jgi:hypothetical protein
MDDLRIRQHLSGSDQSVTGVVHDHVDVVEMLERGIDHVADGRGVC